MNVNVTAVECPCRLNLLPGLRVGGDASGNLEVAFIGACIVLDGVAGADEMSVSVC
jgi:hypothetical protein